MPEGTLSSETTEPLTSPLSHTHHSHPQTLSALDTDSYTAHRLHHASPSHLHLTTRRIFIGPIPEGWLKSHRRDWYRHHLNINYSSRTPTFSANSNISRTRQLTGLDGPSVSARYRAFAMPDDAVDEAEENHGDDIVNLAAGSEGERDRVDSGTGKTTTETPPAIAVARSAETEDETVGGETQGTSGSRAIGLDQEDTRERPVSRGRPTQPRRTSTKSFMTAHEVQAVEPESIEAAEERRKSQPMEEPQIGARISTTDGPSTEENRLSSVTSMFTRPSTTLEMGSDNSNTSLIGHEEGARRKRNKSPKDSMFKSIVTKVGTPSKRIPSGSPVQSSPLTNGATPTNGTTVVNGDSPSHRQRSKVQFNVPETEGRRAELQARARVAQVNMRRASRAVLRRNVTDGAVIKMERMLVRIDTTPDKLTAEFDENEAHKTITRTTEKWREYMVVCRESTDKEAEFRLQMYSSRVIPAVEAKNSKRPKYEILLSRKHCGVNLYSALDKTIGLWTASAKRSGSTIYLMQPQTGSNAMEWYTFLRQIMGWHRSSLLQVNVPDLGVALRLNNPFLDLETNRNISEAAEGDDDAVLRTMREEQVVAGKIKDNCMDLLLKSTEYGDIVAEWQKREKIGLAWKRYDRLEWIHGTNERKMYGTIAMQKSHELELRPKTHYPTTVKTSKGKTWTEPPPIEGFLVRLTSQTGNDKRLGKMFFKRLYFSMQDQYLCFSRPARAAPPPPPKLPVSEDSRIPTSRQISQNIPLIYSINPYPVENEKITWMSAGESAKKQHDKDAFDESARKTTNLLHSDGYIDLTQVVKVRVMVHGASPEDDHIDEGSDVDFNDRMDGDHVGDDGATGEVEKDRTFELVLRNGLIVRLQAYNQMTRNEWISRLRPLVRYWTRRRIQDTNLYKETRARNLAALNIDEVTEAEVGQFAQKWEVMKTFASPKLYHLCGISACRAIHLSGPLFHKPRKHASFRACDVVLSQGQLILFEKTLRKKTGKAIPATHSSRTTSLGLNQCYLYSGLLTESDLLYTNRTFDPNRPGKTALPRIWRNDAWSSADEDVMTTFVIWHGRKRSLFRSSGDGAGGTAAARPSSSASGPSNASSSDITSVSRIGSIGGDGEPGEAGGRHARLRLVSRLGVPGRSVVFKARSRAERDHWVLAIAMEMERLRRDEEVRVTG